MLQHQGHSCYNKKDVGPAWGSIALQLGYIVKRSDERKAKERPFIEDLNHGSPSLQKMGSDPEGTRERLTRRDYTSWEERMIR